MRHCPGSRSVHIALLALGLAACATGPELDILIHQSDHGSVYLERIPDRSFQTAHPITIPPTTVAKVLSGVFMKDNQGLLQNLMAGKPEAVRAFSDNEIAYLAPLLSEGLTRAASDQQVGFHVTHVGVPAYSQAVGAGVGSSEPPLRLKSMESTKASLFAYGQSLHLTFSEYRHRPEPAGTVNMANRRIPDQTGLANRSIMFSPESAKRPDSFLHRLSTAHTVVIDYELLASMPTEPSAATPQPGASVKDQPAPSNSELEALKKELQDIRRQLTEQEAERTRSQPKKSVPSK